MTTTIVQTYALPSSQSEKSSVISIQLKEPSLDQKIAIQLAPLASQHHKSEYNRIKFGPNGCPMVYVPLSIHVPEQFRTIQQTQESFAKTIVPWWPAVLNHGPLVPRHLPLRLGASGADPSASSDLQNELSAAMDEPLSQHLASPSFNPSVTFVLKTSDSHPINISSIIPIDLIPVISLRLISSRKSHPTIFDLPLAFLLDRITASHSVFPQMPTPVPLSLDPALPSNSLRSEGETEKQKQFEPTYVRQDQTSVASAFSEAISSGIPVQGQAPTPVPDSLANSAEFCFVAPPTPALSSWVDLKSITDKDNLSNLTTLREHDPFKFNFRPQPPAPPIQRSKSQPPPSDFTPSLLQPDHRQSLKKNNASSITRPTTPIANALVRPHTTAFGETTSSSTFPATPAQAQPPVVRLGNLYLSSCPGKKVRLDGPVKGRGGVCRDLDADLARISEIGVACIVCCLDDNELSFLGAPWPSYLAAAARQSLTVLRLPLPEGFAPLSPASLDGPLDRLIREYTLRGKSVLVHCRGGVGRAGLVSACWMLRLGLCGWIETGATTDLLSGESGTAGAEGGVRRDTLQLVERVVGVVRKRRSMKAIETFEQVKFLVDYIDFLREKGRLGL